jgi:hypothetical protein
VSDELVERSAELEQQACSLRQCAWLAGQLYDAFKANGLPDQVAADMTFEWWALQPDE